MEPGEQSSRREAGEAELGAPAAPTPGPEAAAGPGTARRGAGVRTGIEAGMGAAAEGLEWVRRMLECSPPVSPRGSALLEERRPGPLQVSHVADLHGADFGAPTPALGLAGGLGLQNCGSEVQGRNVNDQVRLWRQTTLGQHHLRQHHHQQQQQQQLTLPPSPSPAAAQSQQLVSLSPSGAPSASPGASPSAAEQRFLQALLEQLAGDPNAAANQRGSPSGRTPSAGENQGTAQQRHQRQQQQQLPGKLVTESAQLQNAASTLSSLLALGGSTSPSTQPQPRSRLPPLLASQNQPLAHPSTSLTSAGLTLSPSGATTTTMDPPVALGASLGKPEDERQALLETVSTVMAKFLGFSAPAVSSQGSCSSAHTVSCGSGLPPVHRQAVHLPHSPHSPLSHPHSPHSLPNSPGLASSSHAQAPPPSPLGPTVSHPGSPNSSTGRPGQGIGVKAGAAEPKKNLLMEVLARSMSGGTNLSGQGAGEVGALVRSLSAASGLLSGQGQGGTTLGTTKDARVGKQQTKIQSQQERENQLILDALSKSLATMAGVGQAHQKAAKEDSTGTSAGRAAAVLQQEVSMERGGRGSRSSAAASAMRMPSPPASTHSGGRGSAGARPVSPAPAAAAGPLELGDLSARAGVGGQLSFSGLSAQRLGQALEHGQCVAWGEQGGIEPRVHGRTGQGQRQQFLDQSSSLREGSGPTARLWRGSTDQGLEAGISEGALELKGTVEGKKRQWDEGDSGAGLTRKSASLESGRGLMEGNLGSFTARHILGEASLVDLDSGSPSSMEEEDEFLRACGPGKRRRILRERQRRSNMRDQVKRLHSLLPRRVSDSIAQDTVSVIQAAADFIEELLGQTRGDQGMAEQQQQQQEQQEAEPQPKEESNEAGQVQEWVLDEEEVAEKREGETDEAEEHGQPKMEQGPAVSKVTREELGMIIDQEIGVAGEELPENEELQTLQ